MAAEARSDMEPDDLAWVDTVPVRRARAKRITISDVEWAKAATPAPGQPAIRTATFWINSTEVMAVLIEETTVACDGSTKEATEPGQPRVRLGGRSYLLFVEAAAQNSSP